MTTPNHELLALADRVEAGVEPPAALEYAVLCVVDPRAIKTGPLLGDPRYLRSLDAAMSVADGLSEQAIWVIWNEALTRCSKFDKDLRRDLARYWAAAALRAHANQEQSK